MERKEEEFFSLLFLPISQTTVVLELIFYQTSLFGAMEVLHMAGIPRTKRSCSQTFFLIILILIEPQSKIYQMVLNQKLYQIFFIKIIKFVLKE